MSKWDCEISGNVRDNVDDTTIVRLIENGTLKPHSRIRRVGVEDWEQVGHSQFQPLHKQGAGGSLILFYVLFIAFIVFLALIPFLALSVFYWVTLEVPF